MRSVRVAVDAMGGDYAPEAIVDGAVRAARGLRRGSVVLVGDRAQVEEELKKYKYPPDRLSLVHASEVVEMHESPSKAMRSKPHSSIRVAIDLMREGEVDAVVTAGNSGAAMAIAIWRLKKLEGVDRPALASLHPSLRGYTVVLDVGGNVDCRPIHLVQFAIMGSLYAQLVLRKANPKVGLLSNGTEETKGNELTRKVHQLLKKSPLNYIGYVEGRDIYVGEVDVVVCDGFVGNVVLKTSEGIGEFMREAFRGGVGKNLFRRMGYFLIRRIVHVLQEKMDYSHYGGVPLLGINGVCFICHGHSSPKAIESAVYAASDYVTQGVNQSLEKALRESELKSWGQAALRFWEQIKDKMGH